MNYLKILVAVITSPLLLLVGIIYVTEALVLWLTEEI